MNLIRTVIIVAILGGTAAAPGRSTAAPHSGLMTSTQAPIASCVFPRPDCIPSVRGVAVADYPGPPLTGERAAQTECPAAASGATCGFVEVPLERDDPNGPTTQIYYELYRGESPANSVLVPDFGGPGQSTTALRERLAFPLFPSAGSDLLLIDSRGTGRSAAIDCPELHQGDLDFHRYVDAQADCTARLGDASDDYATGDIALDTRDVVSELGYGQVDFYGMHYGALHVIAFAARFPGMVRSIVLESPFAPLSTRPLELGAARANRAVQAFASYCSSSATCNSHIKDPNQALEGLIRRLRHEPVRGDAFAGTELMQLKVGEADLLELMTFPNTMLTFGDLPAAAAAQSGGDPEPLLRLGAETARVLARGEDPDVQWFSAGAFSATKCADVVPLWSREDPLESRISSLRSAVSATPAGHFGSFSRRAASHADYRAFDLGKRCVGWEMSSDPTPLLPNDATFPSAPVMILSGEFDMVSPPEVAGDAAESFSGARHYLIRQSFPLTFEWQYDCVAAAMNDFLVTTELPAQVCEPTDSTYPGVAKFARRARETPLSGVVPLRRDETSRSQRRVALAALRTLEDAVLRGPVGFGTGRCLRGGRYTTNFAVFLPVLKLDDCKLSRDVSVSGKGEWDSVLFAGAGYLDATLEIRGRLEGRVAVRGFFGGLRGEEVEVHGAIQGRKVALVLPSS